MLDSMKNIWLIVVFVSSCSLISNNDTEGSGRYYDEIELLFIDVSENRESYNLQGERVEIWHPPRGMSYDSNYYQNDTVFFAFQEIDDTKPEVLIRANKQYFELINKYPSKIKHLQTTELENLNVLIDRIDELTVIISNNEENYNLAIGDSLLFEYVLYSEDETYYTVNKTVFKNLGIKKLTNLYF